MGGIGRNVDWGWSALRPFDLSEDCRDDELAVRHTLLEQDVSLRPEWDEAGPQNFRIRIKPKYILNITF